MNQSIHAVDLMAWLMSAEPLTATAVLLRQCHKIEAADLAVGTLTLRGNRLLHIEGTTNTNPEEKKRVVLPSLRARNGLGVYCERRRKNLYHWR